jgi:spore protease
MFKHRTDLAVEAWQLAGEQAKEKEKLSGVDTKEYTEGGANITVVDILDERGEQAVGKAKGRYVTLEFDPRHLSDNFTSIVETAAKELKGLLPGTDDSDAASVLIIGLGNWHITPDAIGPRTVENIMVTRHLVEQMPEYFSSFRRVSALAPGVLGITGMESLDIIRGVCSNVKPDYIIAVDALVSRSVSRLCRTIQLSDTGISPGSGIGNTRASIGRDSLGIPVIAAGIPTVVDAATLAYDMVEQSGGTPNAESLDKMSGMLHVSPKDVDKKVQDIAKLLGYAINMALHDLSVEDITSFLS